MISVEFTREELDELMAWAKTAEAKGPLFTKLNIAWVECVNGRETETAKPPAKLDPYVAKRLNENSD